VEPVGVDYERVVVEQHRVVAVALFERLMYVSELKEILKASLLRLDSTSSGR
jgi:hypothetical protein